MGIRYMCGYLFGCCISFKGYGKLFDSQSHKLASKVITTLKETPSLKPRFSKPDLESLFLSVYSDESAISPNDHRSELGFIIFIMNSTNHCHIMQYSYLKARRSNGLSLPGEVLDLLDTFDHSYLLKHDFQRTLGKQVPIMMLTQSRLLFDVITDNRYTTEARLRVDIAAVREAYSQNLTSDIPLTDRVYNNAEPLTRIIHSLLQQKR